MRVAILGFLLASAVQAQDIPEDDFHDNPLGTRPLQLHTVNGLLVPAIAVGAIALFTKANNEGEKRIELFDDIGYSKGYKYPHTALTQNNIGLMYHLRSYVAIGAELTALHASDDFNSTYGLGLRPFARFYMYHSENVNVYFESGAGLACTHDEFPAPTDQDGRLGTRINGISKYGLGAGFRIHGDYHIHVGIRHTHMSNGNVAGEERNPSHDSNGAFIGASMKW